MGRDRWLRAVPVGIAMVGACALASWPACAEGGKSGPTAQILADAAGQRAILYEEDPNDPNGRRFSGSATWRTKIVPVGRPNEAPARETAVEAVIAIPERGLSLTLTLRRNTDASLPAAHTIELRFKLSDAAPAGIGSVPGMLMKTGEAARGVPLAGTSVKVTTGFFLVGLSAVAAERHRNEYLMKEHGWIDVPIVYDNGRRAILAFDKGQPGEAAFTAAFAAWEGAATPAGETPPGRAQDPAVTRSPAPAESGPPPRDHPQ